MGMWKLQENPKELLKELKRDKRIELSMLRSLIFSPNKDCMPASALDLDSQEEPTGTF